MSVLRKALVLWLVALAASPLTYPFATCDLLDLFGEAPPSAISAVKPPATNHAPVLVSSSLRMAVVSQHSDTDVGLDTRVVPSFVQHSSPLRI